MILDALSDLALDRAQKRAAERKLTAHETGHQRNGADGLYLYDVQSHSRPGVFHHVMLSFSARGIEYKCSCRAGEVGLICQHVGSVLALQGITPMPEEPEPAPKPAMSTAKFLELANGTPEDIEAVYGYHAPLKRGR